MRTRQVATGLVVAVAVAVAAGLALSEVGRGTAADPTLAPLPDAFADGVPAPADEVVLSLSVDTEVVDWDLATLGLLDQQELTILEPFVERTITFRGPVWVDVLRASGADVGPDGHELAVLTALDDYVTELPVAASALGETMLATSADDAPIGIDEGGPIRLVFPDDSPLAENANHWIWSLRSGVVR